MCLVATGIIATASAVFAKENDMEKANSKRTLVVYFSHSGNTKQIADKIAAAVNADTTRIETITPYTGSMEEVSRQGKAEIDSGYKPEIKPLDDIADYDRIIVGTPTWWYTMAPAVATFFSTADLDGKEVVLFMTNAGWPGHVIKDMRDAAGKGADVIASKEILFASDGGSRMITPESEIDTWIASWK